MTTAPLEKNEKLKDKPQRINTFKRLINFSKPESGRIIIGLTALSVNSLTNLSFPWLMGKAVDRVTDSEPEKFHIFLAGTAGIILVGSIASWIRVYCLGTASDLISARLRKQLFDSYMDKDMVFYDASRTGEMITTLDKDVKNAADAVTEKLSAGIRSLNSSFNGSILLFTTSPQLCGVSLGLVPLVGIGAMYMAKYSRKIAEKLRSNESETISFALERFSSISTVRLNCREIKEKDTFAEFTDNSKEIARKSYFAQGAFMSFINFSTNISLISVLYVGGGLIVQGMY